MASLSERLTAWWGRASGSEQQDAAATEAAAARKPVAAKPQRAQVVQPQVFDENECWWMQPLDRPEYALLEGIDVQAICAQVENAVHNGSFSLTEIPGNILRIIQILNDPNFNYGEVEHVIKSSPALAGELIRVANSASMSRGVKISSLRVALPRLGPNKIKAVLYFTVANTQLASDPVFKRVATLIVEHSYTVALIASYLSHRYYPDPDHAFLAGLLHDVGKMAILQEIANNFDIPVSDEVPLLEESFAEILPAYHEHAGVAVARHWNLADEIITAIGHHHEFDESSGGEGGDDLAAHLAALIQVSDLLATRLGRGCWTEPTPLFDLPVAQFLCIESDPGTVRFLEDIPASIGRHLPGQDGDESA